MEVTVGTQKINPSKLENVKVEAGTGYFKTSWNGNEIKPEMGTVTISKKNEGIAWGGLYWQYFEDLDDLYYYVVEEVFTEIFDAGFSYSEMTDDLFEFAKISFDFDYQGFKKESRHKYMSNVFRSISGNNEYLEMYNKKRTKYIEDILDRLDLSNIRFNTREEQIKMYQMIQELKISVINRTMMKNLSKEEAFSEFEWYLDILKTGLLKEE